MPTILGDPYVDDRGNEGEPVALLWLSLFTDHTMWRHQISALRSAGWRTPAVDPPGHARSKGVDRAFTTDECTEAALAVLDATDVRTPVVVLGTPAPRIALFAPDRVRGMVLVNTTAESATPFDRVKNTLLTKLLAIAALDKVVDGMPLGLQLSPETCRRRPELGAELSKSFRSWNRRGLINTVRAVLVDRDSAFDALRYVKAPALVVSGKEDAILPSRYSRRIAEKLPNARHVEVAGASHLTPLERPEESNTLILEFLAKSKP